VIIEVAVGVGVRVDVVVRVGVKEGVVVYVGVVSGITGVSVNEGLGVEVLVGVGSKAVEVGVGEKVPVDEGLGVWVMVEVGVKVTVVGGVDVAGFVGCTVMGRVQAQGSVIRTMRRERKMLFMVEAILHHAQRSHEDIGLFLEN
jgi:hypothetical protein